MSPQPKNMDPKTQENPNLRPSSSSTESEPTLYNDLTETLSNLTFDKTDLSLNPSKSIQNPIYNQWWKVNPKSKTLPEKDNNHQSSSCIKCPSSVRSDQTNVTSKSSKILLFCFLTNFL